MDLMPNPSLDKVDRILSALSASQSTVSANIANAQTPGYTAQKSTFTDFLRTDNPFETSLSKSMGEPLLGPHGIDTGHSVDIAQEMIAMQKNLLFYSMTTRRTSTIFNNLKAASQVGR